MSLVAISSVGHAFASSTNSAEDDFQRANQTGGWGALSNKDGLPPASWVPTCSLTCWQNQLASSPYASIAADTAIVTYTGANGHKIAGAVNVAPQQGGDTLAMVSFTRLDSALAGVTLDVSDPNDWYEAELTTTGQDAPTSPPSGPALEIIKRVGGVMVPEARLAFPLAAAKAAYWIRLHVLAIAGADLVEARAWRTGSPEPGGWLLGWTDASPLPAGRPGAMADWMATPAVGEQVLFKAWAFAAAGYASPPH